MYESGRPALKDQLKEHKFQIGQTVFFTSRPIGHMAVNGSYQVVKLLPSDGDDYQYRIKSAELRTAATVGPELPIVAAIR